MLAKLGLAFGKVADLEKVEYIGCGGTSYSYVNPSSGRNAEYSEDYSLRKNSENGGWNLVCTRGTSQTDGPEENLIGHFSKLEYGVMLLDSLAKTSKLRPDKEYGGDDRHASLRQVKRALELKKE